MVAALLKVHHDVEQGDLISSALRIQSLKVLGQNQLVVFPVGKNNNNKINCYSFFLDRYYKEVQGTKIDIHIPTR